MTRDSLFRFALVGTLLWSSAASAQQFRFEHYTVNDGLSSATVFDMAQDEQGALWVGTQLGLCRFNGQDFRSFGVIDGLPGNSVYKVRPDDQGRLWLATFSGVGYWKDGAYTGIDFEEPLAPGDRLTSFAVAPDGTYYFTSKRHLFTFEDGVARKLPFESDELDGKIRGAVLHHADEDGNIWLASAQEILRLRDGRMKRVFRDERFARSHFITEDDRGRTLFVSSYFVRELRGDSLVPVYPKIEALLRSELEHDNDGPPGLSAFFIDPEGNWWIGTFTSGLYFFRRDRLEEGHAVRYMEREGILAIDQDREGNLWIGTEAAGLHLLSYRARQVRNFRETELEATSDRFGKSARGADGSWWNFRGRTLTASRDGDTLRAGRIGNVYDIEPGPGNSVYLAGSSGLVNLEWDPLSRVQRGDVAPQRDRARAHPARALPPRRPADPRRLVRPAARPGLVLHVRGDLPDAGCRR